MVEKNGKIKRSKHYYDYTRNMSAEQIKKFQDKQKKLKEKTSTKD
tara:strand:- start:2844 stop:2978 length:135 start_codon:yes stop_codon:yes gene_type:complete